MLTAELTAEDKSITNWRPKTPVLMLRTCDSKRKGYGGFQWPEKGYVEAPGWNPEPVCGGGLHGLAWGKGSANYLVLGSPNWIVFECDAAELVGVPVNPGSELIDKHKCKRANVLFCGNRSDATNFLYSHELYPSKSDVGVFGTSTSGDNGTSTSGDYGTSTSGDYGTSTSGYYGTSTSGYKGTSTSGDYGTSTSGDNGTSTSGHYGTSTSGHYGTSTSGHYGVIAIQYWNGKRYKTRIARIKDEDGDGELEPNTPYRLDESGNWRVVK